MEELYQVFRIPKKRKGEFRVIEAPNDELKAKQRASVHRLEWPLQVSPVAHGFCHARNIATMAEPHVDKEWVLAVDLKDFFPSVSWEQFRKVAMRQYNQHKERTRKRDLKGRVWETADEFEDELKLHFNDFRDGKGLRLPQGAPGSPMLSNILMHDVDWRLLWKCDAMNVSYTRYADDLVFSGDEKKMVWAAFHIMKGEIKGMGLRVNWKKIRMMRRTRRQNVCGVVVNEKVNLAREWRRNLRAAIHQFGVGVAGDERKDVEEYFITKKVGDRVQLFLKGGWRKEGDEWKFHPVADEWKRVGGDFESREHALNWALKQRGHIRGRLAFRHMILERERSSPDNHQICAVERMKRRS